MEKLVTEWPTVSAKHAPHLGRQFSVTVIRVKAKLVVVGAVAVSRKLLTHSVVFTVPLSLSLSLSLSLPPFLCVCRQDKEERWWLLLQGNSRANCLPLCAASARGVGELEQHQPAWTR